MAYLKPQLLACPNCRFSAEVNWVIGIGPNSKPGEKPSRKLHYVAPFLRSAEDRSVLLCPEYETRVS